MPFQEQKKKPSPASEVKASIVRLDIHLYKQNVETTE